MPDETALHLEALGNLFRISSPDESVRVELARLWRPLLTGAGDVSEARSFRTVRAAGAWEVWQGPGRLGVAGDAASLVTLVSTALNSAAIRASSDLVVHAGGVARDERVVALAGPSGQGKSTLTAACLLEGWEYVSDEALQLRPDGAVTPYPKPVGLAAASRTLLGLSDPTSPGDESLWGVDDLGGRLAGARLRLADVVFLDRDDEAPDTAEIVPLHRSEILSGLLALSFNHYRLPGASVELLASTAAICRAWRLHYRDARGAARVLGERFPSAVLSRPSTSGPARDDRDASR